MAADLSTTIMAKSDQLNADDLIGRSITITVNRVAVKIGDQPVSIGYEGDNGKPYKPCKSMLRVLVNSWGSNGDAYLGRSMTLFRDETVTFGGMAVGGIRISHLSDIGNSPITMSLTAAKASKKPYTVKPLVIAQQQPAIPLVDVAELLKQGDAAAAKGTPALQKWWGSLGGSNQKQLTEDQRNGWKAKAAGVDTVNATAASAGDEEPMKL